VQPRDVVVWVTLGRPGLAILFVHLRPAFPIKVG